MKTVMILIVCLAIAVPALGLDITGGGGQTTKQTLDGKSRVVPTPYTYAIKEGDIEGHYAYDAVGHNGSVGTAFELIWDYSDGSPFISAVTSVRISSSSGTDSGNTVYVSGLDENYELFNATVILNGQTPVTLTGASPYRIFRMVNTSPTEYVGDIYAAGIDASYAGGVPQEDSLVLGKIEDTWGQTQSAFFTVPIGKTAYITSGKVSTSSSKATTIVISIRPPGESWRVERPIEIYQDFFMFSLDFPIRVEALSDIGIFAKVGVAGGDVTGTLNLWYED